MLDDFGNELEEIRREVVEARSLSIRTNNLVNALSADLNSIAKRQQATDRKVKWDSAIAYVVTVVVMLLVGKIVVDARVESVRALSKDGRDELARLQKEVAHLRERQDGRLRSERSAATYFQLIEQKKHLEMLKGYDEISKQDLSRTEKLVFAQARERARVELSLALYHEGLDYVRTRRWHEAERALNRSIQYKGDAAHSPHAQYQLARALKALGQQRKAIPLLMKLSEASTDKEIMDEATFLLAQAQVDIEAYNDAKASLRAFLRRFPGNSLTNDARSLLASIKLRH